MRIQYGLVLGGFSYVDVFSFTSECC